MGKIGEIRRKCARLASTFSTLLHGRMALWPLQRNIYVEKKKKHKIKSSLSIQPEPLTPHSRSSTKED
jgi:hypothetical protein